MITFFPYNCHANNKIVWNEPTAVAHNEKLFQGMQYAVTITHKSMLPSLNTQMIWLDKLLLPTTLNRTTVNYPSQMNL